MLTFTFELKIIKSLSTLAIFLLIIFTAYSIRLYNFDKKTEHINGFYPLPSQSAYFFQKVKNIVQNKTLSKTSYWEPSIYLLSYAYKFFNPKTNNSLKTENIQDSLLFYSRILHSISAGLIFLLLLQLKCSKFLSLSGGFLYSVLPGTVGSFTLLSLSSACIGIPLMTVLLICLIKCIRDTTNLNLLVLCTIIVINITLYALSNILIFSVIAFLFMKFFLVKRKQREIKKILMAVSSLAFISSAVLAITLKRPGLFTINIAFCPCAICFLLCQNKNLMHKISYTLLTLLASMAASCYLFINNPRVVGTLLNLLIEKIKFSNEPPLNPTLLDFNNRFLWGTQFPSATLVSTWIAFSFSLVVLFLLLLIILSYSKYREKLISNTNYLFVIIIFAVYLTVYAFFANILLPAMLFFCLSIPIMSEIVAKNLSKIKKTLLYSALVIVTCFETDKTLALSSKNRNSAILKSQFINWMNKGREFKSKTFLAAYPYSILLTTYADIETLPSINEFSTMGFEQLKDFYSALYSSHKADLKNYCNSLNIDFLIITKDFISGPSKQNYFLPWEPRYLAGINLLPEQSPAYRLIMNSSCSRHFYKIDETLPDFLDDYFYIFKFISEEDSLKAVELRHEAEELIKLGKDKEAKLTVVKSLDLAPNQLETRFIYYQLYDKWPILTRNGITGKDV